jgi:hypothetical protein
MVHYSGGQFCDEIRDYDLTVHIICDPKISIIVDYRMYETHECFKHVEFKHKSGCKID